MMNDDFTARFRNVAWTALRIAAGVAYFSHGAQKLLGWFGGMGPTGGAVPLMSRFGLAGAIETTLGALIIVGLFTRPAAFLASGEMAVTYFWMHWGQSGHMWWWQNRGEVPLLYAFIWLLFAAWGAGPVSLDALLRRSAALPGSAPGPARTDPTEYPLREQASRRRRNVPRI